MAGAVTGCASDRGVAEFAVYRAAYSEVGRTGDAILDRLAAAERRLHARANPFEPATGAFSPDAAVFLVETVDPPSTAALRRALRAVELYTEALSALSSGETATAMAGRLGLIGALGTEALGAAAVAPPAQAVNAAMGALAPFAAQGLGLATRAQFRARLIETAPVMDDILARTREASAPVFAALAQRVRQGVFDDPSGRDFNAAEIAELQALRRLLAHWVVLLDASRAALQRAVAASATRDAVGLQAMLATSEALASTAQSARRSLAGAAAP